MNPSQLKTTITSNTQQKASDITTCAHLTLVFRPLGNDFMKGNDKLMTLSV